VRDAAAGRADEVVEHVLRPLEVGDDAVHERRDERHVARLAALHLVCLAPDGDGLARQAVDGHDRRLVHHDAAPAHGDDRRRRAHVDRHRVRDQIAQPREAQTRTRLSHE
jgi:hypothetical protein